MPLSLLEDDARSQASGPAAQAGFDLQSATTLFWKPVPLLLRQADREDQHEELTFRILTGVSRSNHSMRVLRIHISSESDLFFLHSLEVSEEDFQSLKSEQGILVDFASFPVKIITLLDKCTAPQPADAPRFQAVLTVRGSESLFKIVETNDFKQLPHITLAFRPGNDAAIKQFLAFRLLEVKGNVEELTGQLSKSQGDYGHTQAELDSTRQQLARIQAQYDKHLLEVQAESKTQHAAALEERARERAELKDAHDRELAEVQRKLREQVEQLNARVLDQDAENRKLRAAKYELDTKVSELSHRLGSAEGGNRALEEEVGRLRAANTQLAQEKHDRDVAANEHRARISTLDEKVAAQTEVIDQQKSRIRDLEASLRQLDSRCSELKEAVAGHEQRAKDAQAEVLKANTIIEKLTLDLKSSKEKMKRKQAIIVRQEEELQARDQQLAAAQRECSALSQAVEAAKAEVSGLRAENSELKGKLEDSKQQLQSNEQMIRWLNQQVTEAQLGPSTSAGLAALPGGGGGSRYASAALAYRPATAALTAAPSAATGTVSSLPPPAALHSTAGLAAGTPAAGLQTSTAAANGLNSTYASKYGTSLQGGSTFNTAIKPYAGAASPSRGTTPAPSYTHNGHGGVGGMPRYGATAGMSEYATPAAGLVNHHDTSAAPSSRFFAR